MSTRSSLAYGEHFHFYHDLMDEDDAVHLRISEPCGHERTITIPIDIWEIIRHTGGARLDLVNVGDPELQERATGEIDARITEYKAAKTKGAKAWIAFGGSLVYGDLKWSRKRQVQHAVDHYKAERERQKALVEKIASHKMYNR